MLEKRDAGKGQYQFFNLKFFYNSVLFGALTEDLRPEYSLSDSLEKLFRPILFFRTPRIWISDRKGIMRNRREASDSSERKKKGKEGRKKGLTEVVDWGQSILSFYGILVWDF